MTWTTIEERIEGLISGVIGTRFQFFIGAASDKNSYLQFTVRGDVDITVGASAYLLPRTDVMPNLIRRMLPAKLTRFLDHRIDFNFSEVKKHQILTTQDKQRLLVSSTFDQHGVAKLVDCTKYADEQVVLFPTIWKNEYDLRTDLRNDSAIGEHFPSNIKTKR